MKLLIFLIFISTNLNAKLLDKTVAIVNDQVITLSQIKRIKDNLGARKSVSPRMYPKATYTNKDLVKKRIQVTLIRNKLTEMGYVINDEQVESEVSSMEKRLGLNREALLDFLNNNNFSFDEYFELIRESIEYNLFVGKIVRPLVSITDQDVKNAYYKNNSANKTLNFKYTLVDFSLPKNQFKKGMLKNFRSTLKKFQQTGVLPENYKEVSTNVIEDISEDGLASKLKRVLKKTDEGSFSKYVLLGGSYHVFFVKSKDLAESSEFLEARQSIQNELFNKSITSISKNWYDSESTKYFIKIYL